MMWFVGVLFGFFLLVSPIFFHKIMDKLMVSRIINSKMYILAKICIIEVYLLKYYLKANSYIDILQTTNLQSVKYYGTLCRYNWSMPQCRNFMRIYVMRNKCHVRWLLFHFQRMLITGLGQWTLILASNFFEKKLQIHI